MTDPTPKAIKRRRTTGRKADPRTKRVNHPLPKTPRNGRPTLLLDGYHPDTGTWDANTPAGTIIAAIRAGAPRTTAVALVDVSRANLYIWLARGREHTPEGDNWDRKAVPASELPYVDFARALDRNESLYELALIRVVQAGALQDPNLALKVLARKNPVWQERTAIDVTTTTEDVGADPYLLVRDDPNVIASLAAVAHAIEDKRQTLTALPAGPVIDTTATDEEPSP